MSGAEDGNCSVHPEADADRRAFLTRTGADPARAITMAQLHGSTVLAVGEGEAGRIAGEADGLATNIPGLPLCVSVADCVPVLLYSPGPAAIAVLHSGREGTYQNIVRAGVQLLCDRYSCHPGGLHAVIGPSICGKAYEVSPEMAQRFRNAGYPVEHRHLDLPAMVASQLLRAGVAPERIHREDICTFQDTRFHSYRRDATPERNLAVLMI